MYVPPESSLPACCCRLTDPTLTLRDLLVDVQGRKWAQHITEGVTAWLLAAVYILGTVISGFPAFHAIMVRLHTLNEQDCCAQGSARQGEGRKRPKECLTPAKLSEAGCVLQLPGQHLASVRYVSRGLDALLYVFSPVVACYLLRLLQRRQLLARLGKRVILVCDVPWCHQVQPCQHWPCLAFFALPSDLMKHLCAGARDLCQQDVFAQLRGDIRGGVHPVPAKASAHEWGLQCPLSCLWHVQVHGCNPRDHMVHRMTHRCVPACCCCSTWLWCSPRACQASCCCTTCLFKVHELKAEMLQGFQGHSAGGG